MSQHVIKKDKLQYIISHPYGNCKQRVGVKSGMKLTYITQKNNLPWELKQCGLSDVEIDQLTIKES